MRNWLGVCLKFGDVISDPVRKPDRKPAPTRTDNSDGLEVDEGPITDSILGNSAL
jgi:hypothetical protein